jgi:hypothetical protein
MLSEQRDQTFEKVRLIPRHRLPEGEGLHAYRAANNARR